MKVSRELKEFVIQYENKFKYIGAFKLFKTLILSDVRTQLNTYNRFFFRSDDLEESDDGYLTYDSGKQKIKLGRLLNILIKLDSFSTTSYDTSFKIEQIVNSYKSWYDFKINYRFVEYKGEEILNGYDRKNFLYTRFSDDSMLWSSCMNEKFSQLELYANNEDKVSLLVLEDKNFKIVGRAFLWELDYPYQLFLDRVYYNEESVLNTFNNHAESNKWLYRTQPLEDYKWIKEDVEYDRNEIRMKVKLNTKGVYMYPYMDSLCFQQANDTFTNKIPRFARYRKIRRTSGERGMPLFNF